MAKISHSPEAAALQWYLDNGVDEVLAGQPVDHTKMPDIRSLRQEQPETKTARPVQAPAPAGSGSEILGAAAAKEEAARLAAQAGSLEDLKTAIQDFDGLSIKKTATNMVFSDGHPQAPIMLIGEAPGADEDRQGKPFVGASGQLLDRILSHIGINRHDDDPAKAIYISNILNWRPPGNRTPSPAEIDIALPFIEKHIALIRPKLLIFCGGVSAKALLGRIEGISKLRACFNDYTPITPDIGAGTPIPAISTYHPAYLLRTPAQKRAVWQDMLILQQKRREMGLI